MPSEIGNTATSVYGGIANEGRILSSYTLVNKTSGAIGANLAIKRGNVAVDIIPKDIQIYPNGMYPYGQLPIPVIMNANDQVVLIVTGSCDYTFSYSNPNK
jgi:hypothetical protein